MKQFDLFMETRQCQCQRVLPKKGFNRAFTGVSQTSYEKWLFPIAVCMENWKQRERLGSRSCLKYRSQMNHGFVCKVELIFDLWREWMLNVKLIQIKWNQLTGRREPWTYCQSDMILCQSMWLWLNFQQYRKNNHQTSYRVRSSTLTASSATLAFEVRSLPKPVVGSGFFSPLPGTR